MTTDPTNAHDPTAEPTPDQTAHQTELAGGREPSKQSPGQMNEDDTKHRRGGGDVERDMPEEQDEGGSTRRGGHSQTEMDEEDAGSGSRQKPGRSRNM
jgi:hypothetical protein